MTDKNTLYNEGLSLFAQKRHEQAIEKYQQALEHDPNDAEIYMAISMSYQQLEDYDNALTTAEKAIELAPKEPLYYTNLSRVLVKQGKIQEAEDAMAMSKQLSM